MGGREGGEGWRTPPRTGGQTRSRRVSGAGSVRCGRRGCAAAEVLCCSAVPGRARSVSAQPSRAPRAVNCSPQPLASARLPSGSAALNSIKPPQPRVPPRPVSSCQSSGPFAQLWPKLGHGPGGVRGRGGADRCGEPERGKRAARSRWRGSAERLRSGPAVSPVRAASPGSGRIPSPDDFPNYFFSLYFILCWGGGGRGGGGGRPRLIDGPRARFANFQLRLGGRWEGSVPEPEAADLGALRGRRRLGRADSCFALSHPRSSAHTLFVRVQSGRSRGFGGFSVYEILPPAPRVPRRKCFLPPVVGAYK